MTPELFWHWVGGRRFALAGGSGLVNTVLLWCNKLDKPTFRDLILATIGTYIAANTAQKWKEAKSA